MKKLFFLAFFFIIIAFIPAACGAGYVALQIVQGDYSKFDKAKIIEILSKETLLFYADGQTQLGSLFGQEHRIYVTIDKIPKTMKEAIVSAEDEDFYTNIGIDIKGIVRAAIHNIISKNRQGASTITQQTVKNLYGRKETDLITKFEETINAFKLERTYSKEQILEFYLNQFHVTGNGRGVGVAAKYYFNKDVEDLTLVEAAFIAGSVKGPEKYNPFTKTTIAGQEKAKKEAFTRKNYVIERMFKNRKISKDEYQQALKATIPFNQGRFQYNELTVNQAVMRQLSRPEILQAIGATNVDEIGTMGLHITTTLDKDTQIAAQYGLKQNLSRMQTILKGFSLEPSSSFVNIQKPELYNFYTAHIDSVDSTPSKESVRINFGVPTCLVDTDSVNRIAINNDQINKQGLNKAKEAFLRTLSPGQSILASVKKINSDGSLLCDLETRAKVQGAAIVLDKGKIIAMAGGFSSNEYNRALFAMRQPGSTFKTPTYYAALQLGWSVLDSLSNVRDVFTWQGKFYYPRPDHAPKSLETTILGAGAQSENVASVWLLSHLLDKLNYNQFRDLIKSLDIMKDGQNSTQVISYIANKFNATPDNIEYLKEGILNKIKEDLLTDLNVIHNNSLKTFVRTLHYGSNFDKEFELISNDKSLTDKERKIRQNILKNNFQHWNILAEKAKKALEILNEIAEDKEILSETNKQLLSQFARLTSNSEVIGFISHDPWLPQIASYLIPGTDVYPTGLDHLISLAKNKSELLNANNILLDGVVPLSIIENINQNLSNTLAEVQQKEPLERLFWNADFRYSLGMFYVASMVNSMGVSESLQWVPSFPLGSNTVTLADLSLMYQTFLTGKMYRYFNNSKPNQLLVIKRIEDTSGNLIWEAKGKEVSIVDSFYSVPILNTLRGTVTAGTAYQLNWNVILRSNNEEIDKKLVTQKIRVPVFGKTGTTNNFTNGTYIGFLPYPAAQGDFLSSSNAYTIASYIGYDSNEPMVRKWYKAYGGSAIPAWEEIALNIIKSQNFADKLNWQELAENQSHLVPFHLGSGLSQVIVPMNSGISISSQDPEGDSDNPNEDDNYANDYSEHGKHQFQIYLEGSTSDDVFIPKRKVSFYTPFVYNSNVENQTNQNESSDRKRETQTESNKNNQSGNLNNNSAEPLPLKDNTDKNIEDEISANMMEDIPPPPSELRRLPNTNSAP